MNPSVGVIDIKEGPIRWINVVRGQAPYGGPFGSEYCGVPDSKITPGFPKVHIKAVPLRNFPIFGKTVGWEWKGQDFGLGVITALNEDNSLQRTVMKMQALSNTPVAISVHVNLRSWVIKGYFFTTTLATLELWHFCQTIACQLLATDSPVTHQAPTLEALGAWEKDVLSVLSGFLPQDGLYLAPDIPAKKLSNARGKCSVPESESVLGLVDFTMFGSAKSCLLIGGSGIYYHNGFGAGGGLVQYSEFPNREFKRTGFHKVDLGYGQSLDQGGISLSPEKLADMLSAIRELESKAER